MVALFTRTLLMRAILIQILPKNANALLLLIIACSLLTMTPVFATVNAVADRTVLTINESFNLELVQTESGDGQPDFSVLEKDFSIVAKSQSQQYNLINGKSSSKHVWSLTLMPKISGEVIIPAISIGKEKTNPIPLVIHKSSANQSSANGFSANSGLNQPAINNQEVFIEVQVSPEEEVYVQQKIDLTIFIYYRIRLSNMALGQLTINDVIMEQVGEDKSYNKVIKQQSYMVIERHYALFPQKSGLLTIPAIRFEGTQSISSNLGFGGFFSQRGKPIYKQSNPISLQIKKKADDYSGNHWLPAENVQVISQHSDLSDIKVGDSITITDKIVAKGVLGNLLPALEWPKLDNLKSYPDKATINSQVNANDLYGLREEKMAIIPVTAGQYQLPERKFIWWNTLTNQQQEKIIPGISFTVSEAESSISEADQLAVEQAKQNQLKLNQLKQEQQQLKKQASINHLADPFATNSTGNSETKANNDDIAAKVTNKNFIGYTKTSQNPWFWIWLISSLVLSVFLMLSLYFVYKKSSPGIKYDKNTNKNTDKSNGNEEQIINNIKVACSENNKNKAYSLISQWSNSHFDKKQDHDLELEKAIVKLEQAIYSSNACDWDGSQLNNAFKNYLINSKKNNLKKSDLLPLNPL